MRKNGYIYGMELASLLRRVLEGEDLDSAQAETLMDAMMEGALTPVQIAGALMTLRTRGETLQELIGFARAMRAHSVKVPIENPDLLDTCGTGGDTLKTWNLSTATAFVVAAAGVPVAKHGNRAVSSKCGSADVLEALGANLNLTPEQIAQGIDRVGVGFMFAPLHHPAMRHVAPVRRELGVRTVFNLLGPLTNPANARKQLLGVFSWEWLTLIAEALAQLGTERALIVHGMDGLDEVSPIGVTVAAHLKPDGSVETFEFTPQDLGLEPAPPDALTPGETPQENARILRAALTGDDERRMQAILPSAGAALWVAGRVDDIRDGILLAIRAIESGRAEEVLDDYIAYTQSLRTE
ncbi:MAG: anthranilate phosphoribosyltransferase [Fimbriimonadales bacterium]|nr:MAG: anthranilate phosphoribosyltransferase [Fimbriimonadales bacterium]